MEELEETGISSVSCASAGERSGGPAHYATTVSPKTERLSPTHPRVTAKPLVTWSLMRKTDSRFGQWGFCNLQTQVP